MKRTSIAAPAFALALFIGACAGDGGGGAERGAGSDAAPRDLDAGALRPDARATDSGNDPEASVPLPCGVTMRLLDFKLEPAEIEAASGHLELCVENRGKTPHDLAVRDANGDDLGRTPTLNGGENARLSLELMAGEYGIYCAEPGHDSLGMHGTLTVK